MGLKKQVIQLKDGEQIAVQIVRIMNYGKYLMKTNIALTIVIDDNNTLYSDKQATFTGDIIYYTE